MPQDLVEKQVIYDGNRIRLEILRLRDERTGRISEKEVCVHPGAVVIMGFLPDGRLLLIRNYRYSISQTLIELPAGTLEKGEDPAVCAGRELLEETGYRAGRIVPLLAFYASPGVLTEKMHLFAAYDLTHQGQHLDETEEIEVLPATLAEAVELIQAGKIIDSKTISGVLMYEKCCVQNTENRLQNAK